MDLTWLLHPTDAEWLLYSAVYAFMCVRTLWISARLERRELALANKYPSQAQRVRELCQYFTDHRFSILSKLLYFICFLSSVLMAGMSYAREPFFDTLFGIFGVVMLAYGFLAGLHLALNHKLVAVMRAIDDAKSARTGDAPFSAKPVGGEGFVVIGWVMMASALFIGSCWVFNFPVSLLALLTYAGK